MYNAHCQLDHTSMITVIIHMLYYLHQHPIKRVPRSLQTHRVPSAAVRRGLTVRWCVWILSSRAMTSPLRPSALE